MSKSTDGGHAWTDPTSTGTPVDRPWLETDLSTGMLYEVSSGFLGPIASGDPTTPQSLISDRWLVSSDPPGAGKTHLAIGASIRACQAGPGVAFATAAEWVARLGDAHSQGRLHDELRRLGRIPLLVIDEVGYIPFEAEAADLFFQLVSSRYESASLIVTATNPSDAEAKCSASATVAVAMIDRLVHHAE